ncbi:MAG: hypothetical protein IKP92_05945 [Lachnospiraceae bacterium]|nr:hypothetical protein [Lachnospiraceae bacterium]
MSGCAGIGKTKEDVAKDTLKAKYNEDFDVYEIDSFSGGFDATVSPVNNPDILFMARMGNNGSGETDDYAKRYISNELNQILKNDLSNFFPNAYFRTEISISVVDESVDFRSESLEKNLKNTEEGEGYNREAYLYIYVSNDTKSLKKYKEEYNYLTNQIDKYIDCYQMLPLIVKMYYVDPERMDMIKSYFREDLDIDVYYQEKILGANDYLKGIKGALDDDPGNPPNIAVNLKKDSDGYIGSFEEYVRRREIIENE